MARDSGDETGFSRPGLSVLRERFIAKFLLSVVVVTVVTAGLGAYFYGTATGRLTEEANAELDATAQLQAESVEQWVATLRNQTRAAAALASDERTGRQLQSVAERLHRDVVAVHVVSRGNWTVLSSTNRSVEGQSLSALGVPWAAEGDRVRERTGDPSAVVVGSEPYVSRSGDRVIALASALPGAPGRALVVEANLSVCSNAFPQPDAAASTTVRTGAGTTVCAGDSDAPVDASGPGLGSGFSGEKTETPSGAVTASAPVAGTDWTVVTTVPTAAAFDLRDAIGQYILTLVVVPFFLLGTAAVGIGMRADEELSTLTEHARAMREGDLDVDIETDRSDEFGALARGFAEMRDALKQQIQEAEQARKEAEVARAEAVETSEYLRETAEEYSETMERCARGDLTQRMDPDGQQEAMDRIAADFNEMVRELELTTGQLKQFAGEVSEGGDSVHASATAVRDASEQVAESIQKISDDAHAERERLREVSAELEAVAATLEAAAADRPDDSVDESLDRVRSTARLVEEAIEASETVMAESETVAGAAEEQAAELTEVSRRAQELKRTAEYLGDGIDHFETDDHHEFVFQTGAAESGPDSGTNQ